MIASRTMEVAIVGQIASVGVGDKGHVGGPAHR